MTRESGSTPDWVAGLGLTWSLVPCRSWGMALASPTELLSLWDRSRNHREIKLSHCWGSGRQLCFSHGSRIGCRTRCRRLLFVLLSSFLNNLFLLGWIFGKDSDKISGDRRSKFERLGEILQLLQFRLPIIGCSCALRLMNSHLLRSGKRPELM
jgi:hypothetical protein